MSLTGGTRLGPYEVVEPIGVGGMGTVYRAHDPRMARHVAIKVAAQHFNERFTREVHAIAALNHPNICTLFDVGPDYLVMELVDGPTLAERIKEGPIPLDEALNIARQVAAALDAAHEKGIVHRDLKPGNIKIKPDGTVKVLDFGLAKIGDTPSLVSADSPTVSLFGTQAGIILGTAAYMSPEQARGKPVDKRADVWAFGAVLYEMLTGHQAFQGETITDVLASVVKSEPDWNMIPRRVRQLIQSCLQKEPRDRLRDIGDASHLLQESLPAVPEQAPSRKQVVIWATVAGAAIVVAGIAVFLNFQQPPPPPQELVRFEVSSPGDRIGYFNVSPDGKTILFAAARSDGSRGVFIRSLDSPEARPLPGDMQGLPDPPFWSADSRYIAFAREGKLRKLELASGSIQMIADSPGALRGGTWNAEGTILVGSNRGIFSVPATGGMLTQLTMLDAQRQENSHAYPRFLPDGRHFVYLRRSSSADVSGIYLSSIDPSEEKNSKRLTPSDFSAGFSNGHLFFIRDEVLMAQPLDVQRGVLTGEAFSVAEPVGGILNVAYGLFSVFSNTLVYRRGQTAQTRAYWFDRNGTRGDAIGQPGEYAELSISRDGSRLAFTRRGRTWDIELTEPLRAASMRFTFDSADENNPVWSPDNKQLAFSSSQKGAQTLHVKAADGTRDEQLLLDAGADITPNDWSPDGNYLLYTTSDPKTNLDLWMLSLADRKTKPFLKTRAREGQAQISPDGRFVAYSSDDSGISEIWVRTFPDGGGPWQVSRGGGVEPRWRRDGKELFYRGLNQAMTAVDIKTNGVFQAGTPHVLFVASFAGAGGANRNPRWAPAPDGKKFVAVITDQLDELAPLTVEMNWQRELRR